MKKKEFKVGALVGFVPDARHPYRFIYLSVVIGATRPRKHQRSVPLVYCFETADTSPAYWAAQWVLISPAPETP